MRTRVAATLELSADGPAAPGAPASRSSPARAEQLPGDRRRAEPGPGGLDGEGARVHRAGCGGCGGHPFGVGQPGTPRRGRRGQRRCARCPSSVDVDAVESHSRQSYIHAAPHGRGRRRRFGPRRPEVALKTAPGRGCGAGSASAAGRRRCEQHVGTRLAEPAGRRASSVAASSSGSAPRAHEVVAARDQADQVGCRLQRHAAPAPWTTAAARRPRRRGCASSSRPAGAPRRARRGARRAGRPSRPALPQPRRVRVAQTLGDESPRRDVAGQVQRLRTSCTSRTPARRAAQRRRSRRHQGRRTGTTTGAGGGGGGRSARHRATASSTSTCPIGTCGPSAGRRQ